MSTSAASCPQCGRPGPFHATAAPSAVVDDRFPADAQPASIAPHRPASASPQPRRASAPPPPAERSIAGKAAAAIGIAVLLAWCTVNAPAPQRARADTAADVAPPPPPKPRATVVRWSWERAPEFAGDGALLVEAVLRNDASEPRFVCATVTFYDKAEALVTNERVCTRELAPGAQGIAKGYGDYFARVRTAQLTLDP